MCHLLRHSHAYRTTHSVRIWWSPKRCACREDGGLSVICGQSWSFVKDKVKKPFPDRLTLLVGLLHSLWSSEEHVHEDVVSGTIAATADLTAEFKRIHSQTLISDFTSLHDELKVAFTRVCRILTDTIRTSGADWLNSYNMRLILEVEIY